MESFYRSRKWVPLTEGLPVQGALVLVKMENGLVVCGRWGGAKDGWSHSPFERWGTPVIWAYVESSQ